MTQRGGKAATIEGARSRMLDDVVSGLSASPKSVPSKYFYNCLGSELFDEITALEEYYLTRTETYIMGRFASEMAAEIGPEALLVELGSGSSAKTRVLLEHLEAPAAYVPVDISGDYLEQAADRLRWDHEGLTVLPVVADFTEPFELPTAPTQPARRVAYFPGSTIGNFPAADAEKLLRRLHQLVGPHGGVLIGFDLVKSRDVLEAAYDDASGVTARFNLNVLAHINAALGTDFDPNGFFHSAPFNADASRIEMYLVSRRRQEVKLGEHVFTFEQDEPLLTEYSHKYTPDSFADMAGAAGLTAKKTWTDPESLFCVQFLVPEPAV
jgi:L-histidine N-alpha-methyltransferase